MIRSCALLLVLAALLITSPVAANQECEAKGTLTFEPAQPIAGETVRLIATVDSPNDACRDLVRSEPFVIIQGGLNSELSLVPEGDRFIGSVVAPGTRWIATLYVIGTGAAVAAFELDPSASLTDIRFWYARSPGAVVIISAALVLGVLAVLGQSAHFARAPRWRIRLVQATRRMARRAFRALRSRLKRAKAT